MGERWARMALQYSTARMSLGRRRISPVPTGCADPGLYEKTFMFAFFIYAIIFNSLNTRSEKYNLLEHIGENKNFILVMGAIFILQTIIIEVGGKVFNTTMLEPKALLVSMALAVLIIPVDLIRKAVVRR